MKLTRKNKKGFTIIELVIVIAVIGVLSAILIPVFINLSNQAKVASTESFLKNVNTQISMKEANPDLDESDIKDFNTMSNGVKYASFHGFDVEKISPFDGNEIVWDELNHRFAFVNNGETIYAEAGFRIENAQYMPLLNRAPP